MQDDIILNRIAQLPQPYKGFIESNFIGEVASVFGEGSNFTPRQSEILENALTLYLLFLLNEEKTIDFISRNCEISINDATLVFKGVISTLPDDVAELLRAQPSLRDTPSSKEAGLASEIAETERAFENLQGIRTMAGDMREAQTNQTPTYQSNQADIIRPTTPPAPPSNGPRWETDK